MQRTLMCISLLVVVVLCVSVTWADSIDMVTYTITFNGSAPFPTAGSFTYDPDTQTFSSFLVAWDGRLFDLTPSANAPSTLGSPCGSLTGGAASFALLSGNCVLDNTVWTGRVSPDPIFLFTSYDDTFTNMIKVWANAGVPTPPYDIAGGDWTIAPYLGTVPEPSSGVLFIPAVLSLAIGARNRLTQRLGRGF